MAPRAWFADIVEQGTGGEQMNTTLPLVMGRYSRESLVRRFQGPPLLTWINLNPIMDN